MQVTKGTWHMREQCVPGSLSSSPAQEPGNEARVKSLQLGKCMTKQKEHITMCNLFFFLCVCVKFFKYCLVTFLACTAIYHQSVNFMHTNQWRRKDFFIGGGTLETTHRVVSNLYNNL